MACLSYWEFQQWKYSLITSLGEQIECHRQKGKKLPTRFCGGAAHKHNVLILSDPFNGRIDLQKGFFVKGQKALNDDSPNGSPVGLLQHPKVIWERKSRSLLGFNSKVQKLFPSPS